MIERPADDLGSGKAFVPTSSEIMYQLLRHYTTTWNELSSQDDTFLPQSPPRSDFRPAFVISTNLANDIDEGHLYLISCSLDSQQRRRALSNAPPKSHSKDMTTFQPVNHPHTCRILVHPQGLLCLSSA